MIDNVRFYVLDKEVFDFTTETKKTVELKSSFNRLTGEIEEFPKKGRYYNLKIDLQKNESFITGSLHKLYNLIVNDEEQNYNDFSYCEFEQSLSWLCNDLHIEQKKTKLTNLEFGLNINLPVNADDFLNHMLLLYDYKSSNRNESFGGKGNYREFKMTDYSLKIYNKSKQYKKKGNLVRFEIKITLSRRLKKMGIYNLNDLKKQSSLLNLFQFLCEQFDKLMIIDLMGMEKTLKKVDNELLCDCTNSYYWQSSKNQYSYKINAKLKRECESYIEKNNLDSTKNKIKVLLFKKYQELINCYENILEEAA